MKLMETVVISIFNVLKKDLWILDKLFYGYILPSFHPQQKTIPKLVGLSSISRLSWDI
jgi:hypothetical protein